MPEQLALLTQGMWEVMRRPKGWWEVTVPCFVGLFCLRHCGLSGHSLKANSESMELEFVQVGI